MTSERVRARREELWAFITSRPHQPMTLFDVAQALGRTPGRAFNLDMAAIRHWADESGDQITNCYWDTDQQAHVFQYLPAGDERCVSVTPLRTMARQTRTRLRNVGIRGGWVAANAVRREDRAYGRLNQRMADLVTGVMDAAEEWEHAVRGDTEEEGSPRS